MINNNNCEQWEVCLIQSSTQQPYSCFKRKHFIDQQRNMNWLSELAQKEYELSSLTRTAELLFFFFQAPPMTSWITDLTQEITDSCTLIKRLNLKINCDYLLKLVIINTHQWHFCTTALVKFVATGLAPESLEKQLSTEVAER